MNVVQTWLWLIGTKANAVRLRARITGLKSPPLDPAFGPEPLQCPLTVLYGAEVSRACYADPVLRPVLDAWDTGAVSPDDLRRWCLVIEGGQVHWDQEPFDPMAQVRYVSNCARAYAHERARAERNALTVQRRQ
jgi:hypothetical protein